MLDYVACKEKRNKFLYYLTYFSIILFDFVNCPAFVDIKQTLHYKVAIEQIYQRYLFFMHCSLCLFRISLLDRVFQWLLQRAIFPLGDKKKWLLVALDRWFSYTVTIAPELAWADSKLVVLQRWSLNRFDCNALS